MSRRPCPRGALLRLDASRLAKPIAERDRRSAGRRAKIRSGGDLGIRRRRSVREWEFGAAQAPRCPRVLGRLCKLAHQRFIAAFYAALASVI